MSNNPLDEPVLVTKSDEMLRPGYFEGLCTDYKRYLNVIYKNYIFQQRRIIENDYKYKQIIPYGILHYEKKIFQYKRSISSSEIRLIGSRSIGIGGHINKNDYKDIKKQDQIFYNCLKREINEEVLIETEFKLKIVAVLNDDSDDVSSVHFGIIILGELKEPNVQGRENQIEDCNFVTIESLQENLNKFEKWSQICLNKISDFF